MTSPSFCTTAGERVYIFSRPTSFLLTPHAVRRSANLIGERRLLSFCSPFHSAVQILPTFRPLLPSMQSPQRPASAATANESIQNGFIERARSTAHNFASSRKRASDKALTFLENLRFADHPEVAGPVNISAFAVTNLLTDQLLCADAVAELSTTSKFRKRMICVCSRCCSGVASVFFASSASRTDKTRKPTSRLT